MEPQGTLGKVTNLDSKTELHFLLNPTDFTLSKSFQYNVEPCLGQATPVISYQCGNLSLLSFQLNFDKDINNAFDIGKVEQFLKELNKINPNTKSAPVVEFTMGDFNFKGYINNYSLQIIRFSSDGKATSARLAAEMISNGEHESKGA